MAFYSTALPNVAVSTVDLWPSIANTLMVPWRGSAAPSHSQRSRHTSASIQQKSPAVSAKTDVLSPKTELPDFLNDKAVSPSFLPTPSALASPSMHASIADMARRSIIASNPLLRQMIPNTSSLLLAARAHPGIFQSVHQGGSSARLMSTFRQPIGPNTLLSSNDRRHLLQPRRTFRTTLLSTQQRGFGTSGVSSNLLANREAAANRNPTSATAQNAFYQVLLKANMPLIVVERYNSGRFASNPAATEAYQRALGMISSAAATTSGDLANPAAGLAANSSQLSTAQLQAVGQAMAARARGTNVAVGKGAQGTGAKDAPIHVVVDQAIGDYFFRWVKFILYFVLVTYLSLVVVTMVIESLSQIRRPGSARMDNEVRSEHQKTRFTDVHGCDEAKEELQELVEFLRNPDAFGNLGGKLPKGILLVGPPGTGKTLLARAVAGEAGVPFFYMSGSEFDEIYVGVGAKRVRELFAAAKAKSPSIVFIDELDAIGSRRNARDAAYVKQTLNQLLTELDGFEQNSGVIILGATNFPESLDKALTRPGRFDRHVQVDLPDVRGRIAILEYHAKKVKSETGVDLRAIAQSTSGLSGAELESIVNQAAVHASKAKSAVVTMQDFEWAKDKIIMGAERRSMVISMKEKEMTAYHEAGHALVNYFHENTSNKLYKVTILPRGRSLGHTASLPEMDKYSYTSKDFMAMIDVCLGGKLGEEIRYGTDMVTSGVSSDLERATSVAYQMVSQYGMSEKLGPVEYRTRWKGLSSQTRLLVEDEVQKTLNVAYERTKALLLSKRKELDLLAKALVEYETLDRDEVTLVIRGEKLKGRIAVPPGPMVVPKGPNPLELSEGAGGEDDDDSKPPPPPPTPPATVPRAADSGSGREGM